MLRGNDVYSIGMIFNGLGMFNVPSIITTVVNLAIELIKQAFVFIWNNVIVKLYDFMWFIDSITGFLLLI